MRCLKIVTCGRFRTVVATLDTDADQMPTTAGSRREIRSAEMTERLLDATESLYAEEGPLALTNRRISERAGTTTQSIYTYFDSRDALVEAMYMRVIASVREIVAFVGALVPESPDDFDVIAAFKEGAREYRRFCLAHPGRFKMIRDETANANLPEAISTLGDQVLDAIADVGRSSTGERPSSYESSIRPTISAIHGFFTAELTGFITAEHERDARFDELVDRPLNPGES